MMYYLTQIRFLPRQLVELYLQEVTYLNKERNQIFNAFGMVNRARGYEIRIASDKTKPFKAPLIKRDISIIQGSTTHPPQIHVFEGMTDFISWLAMIRKTKPKGTVLIIHSTKSYALTLDYLKTVSEEAEIHTWLDNDKSGKECSECFTKDLGHSHINQSHYFEPYKDLNEALKHGHMIARTQ